MKSLYITKLKKEVSEFGSRLYSIIKRDDEEFELFYDYNIKDLNLIDDDFADPFLVALIPYAMEHKYDIYCENPVSNDLYYNITTDFIPCMSKYTNYFNEVKIFCETKKKIIENNKAVVTGASCGVDSLYSIFSIIEKTKNLKDNQLTHLLVMNSGSCSWAGGDESYKWFIDESKKSEQLAKELNLGFIYVNTNLMEFYGDTHRTSNFCRMSGVVLGLDKLIKTYHFASAEGINDFNINPKDRDDGEYVYFTCNEMSDDNLRFMLTALSLSRTERVNYIANNPLTNKYLNVCLCGCVNCGICEKCLRTIGALYSMDKLDEFKDAFDVNKFYRKKTRYIAQMIYNKKYQKAMYDFLKTIKKKNPFLYFNACMLKIFYYSPVFTMKKAIKSFAFKILNKDKQSKRYIIVRNFYRKYFKK